MSSLLRWIETLLSPADEPVIRTPESLPLDCNAYIDGLRDHVLRRYY